MLTPSRLEVALDFSFQAQRKPGSALAPERRALFFLLALLSLEPRAALRKPRLRRPLLVFLGAPYRYKLSRHQAELARSRLVLSLPAPRAPSGAHLDELWGSALLNPAWVRLVHAGRAREWLG